MNTCLSSPLRLAMAQLDPTVGDLSGNAQSILSSAQQAQQQGATLLITPELSLMGYPVGDILARHPSLVMAQQRQLEQLVAQLPASLTVLIGCVQPVAPQLPLRHTHPQRYYNSVAVCVGGKVVRYVHKQLLPLYGEFYDPRVFAPAPVTQPPALINVSGWQVGLLICEDQWNDPLQFNPPRYSHNPLGAFFEKAETRPKLIVNLSASTYQLGKPQRRQAMLAQQARHYQVAIAFCNQVGAVDECLFDGHSQLYDAHGRLLAAAKGFQPQLLSVELADTATDQPVIQKSNFVWPTPTFQLPSPLVCEELVQALVMGIRGYFSKTGFQRAVLGISGGVDSAVALALLVKALGGENVLGVTMPTHLTPTQNQSDAQMLITQLGAQWLDMPIGALANATLAQLPILGAWGEPLAQSTAAENVQAMTRAMALRLLGNQYRALPIATSDKSELYMGYATVNGDMSGALAPLGDLPKTTVQAMAQYLKLPQAIATRPPGPDLALNPETGALQRAEETLMPYLFLDEIIFRLEHLGQAVTDMRNEPFLYEAQHALSIEQKRCWLDRFSRRMAQAVFKWWLCPPILITGLGISKTAYRHPITTAQL